MIFKCHQNTCNEIWFEQRAYDKPNYHRCPHCGAHNYEHDALSVEELEKLIVTMKRCLINIVAIF